MVGKIYKKRQHTFKERMENIKSREKWFSRERILLKIISR